MKLSISHTFFGSSHLLISTCMFPYYLRTQEITKSSVGNGSCQSIGAETGHPLVQSLNPQSSHNVAVGNIEAEPWSSHIVAKNNGIFNQSKKVTDNLNGKGDFMDGLRMKDIMGEPSGEELLRGVRGRKTAKPCTTGQPAIEHELTKEQSICTDSILSQLLQQQQQNKESGILLTRVMKGVSSDGSTPHTHNSATQSSVAASSSGVNTRYISSGNGHIQTDGHTTSSASGQLFIQDAFGRIMPLGAPVRDLEYFTAGPGSPLIMVPDQQLIESSRLPSMLTSLTWQGVEMCLLASGVFMVLCNILIIFYILLYRFILYEMKSNI